MNPLLIWCVDQIKKLWAQLQNLGAAIAALQNSIIVISPGGPGSFLSGIGDPEGVKTGQVQGQTYLDVSTGRLWSFAGTPGTNTGWV